MDGYDFDRLKAENNAAREQIKARIPIETYCDGNLERRQAHTYVCPFCGSGTGKNRTAAFTTYPREGRWYCFKCRRGGDIFDLIGDLEGIEDKRAQLERGAELAGITLDKTAGKRGAVSPSKAISSTGTTITPQGGAEMPENAQEQADYTAGREKHRALIAAAREHIGDPEAVAYLSARGFTLDEARAAGLGYDPRRRRIVIPYRGTDYYHIDRSIDHDGDGKYNKPKSDELGAEPLYNRDAIGTDHVLFIVEGALDAMAVELAGFEAVALGGVATDKLLDALGAASKGGIVKCVLMLDNPDIDEAGRATTDKLAAALDAMDGVAYVRYAYHDGAKDAAAEHEAHRGELVKWYGDAAAAACRQAVEVAAKSRETALNKVNVYEASSVIGDLILEDDATDPIPTGFDGLDNLLEGGLPEPGLVVLGATSSAGKTTLAHQIADNIAATRRPVLFVTLEQGRRELAAKSISRMASAVPRASGNRVWLKTADLVTSQGRERTKMDAEKSAILMGALNDYAERIAPWFYILEAADRPTVNDISDAVDVVERMAGRTPVVFIDYLQIIAPVDERATEKKTTDINVSVLRALTKRSGHETCVFVISSLNRSSYAAGGVAFESFKESGSIEYTADLLLGLQPYGLKARTQNEDDDKVVKGITKKLMQEYKEAMGSDDGAHAEIVVLKNRNGAVPSRTAGLYFHAAINTFKDDAGKTAPAPAIII